jgi:hypothetical protein
MKRIFSYILISVTLLCILGTVMWAMMCVQDYHSIANNPSASGVDYLTVMFYPFGLDILSIVGFTSSLIARRLYKSKVVSVFSSIGIILFAGIILLHIVFMMFLWIFT